MKFEALQALYGDCLLLSFPGEGRPTRLLIDGGPGTVFRNALKPRLQKEADTWKERPVRLDAIMVSHIDEDHILGVLDLLEDVREDASPQGPVCQARWLYHNSFDGLLGEGEGGAARSLKAPDILAGIGGATDILDGVSEPDPAALLVLQSYGQGSRLASLAAAMKITRNPPDAAPLMFDGATPVVKSLGPATMTVLGPLKKEVDDLRDAWAKWRGKQDGRAALADYLDKSVPNLSSLVVLVEQDGHSVLLTGDARGDKVLEGLKASRKLADGGTFKVDILKLPHHGSSRNLKLNFFKQVHADHYVVSGDGTYGNPDREALQMIEDARPEGGYVVHLTYSAADCDAQHENWASTRRNKYDQATQNISEIVARWKAGDHIEVREGPVSIELPFTGLPKPKHSTSAEAAPPPTPGYHHPRGLPKPDDKFKLKSTGSTDPDQT